MSAKPVGASATAPPDPFAIVRTRGYTGLLVVAALLGVPISAVAFGFLALTHELQSLTYSDLPRALGFHSTPTWWPVPLLVVAGLLVGLTIRYLPGIGGHKPAEGMKTTGAPTAVELPGIVIAALASLGIGAVLGPEAPLIALGGGLAVWTVRLVKREIRPNASAVVGAAGSFAAVSALLGSPLLGAFLLMEASGLGGAVLGMVLVPGLLASGVGSLIFVGLGSWTGLGTYSLALHHVPRADEPDLAQFGWAVVVGLVAAVVGEGIRRLALFLQARVERRSVVGTALMGLVVGALALAYAEATGKAASGVLYSGQNALDPLLAGSAGYTVGTLLVLIVCKGLAYCASLSCFRGGPVFPAMFVGAAGGIALSHLPGLNVTSGFAMGIGAMCVAMLRLPMTSVLLATLLLGSPGLTVMPLVIVSVVVAYVVSLRLAPEPGGLRDGQGAA
ncbi:chloride channel protein [Streptomyces sp. NBC_00121]|uniref:chloride channel protein n=1 Tax=unclassified Streptomyces TaxID=2593676 RepID=UPI0028C421A9|nr:MULTISPECIES: chloride channel protein [unclassified Streptomyces]WNO63504.1 chloride channel protein [Streptomyces sp. AM2-3-1]WSC68083.1 chloride channel protein [Streptomyces sp. NBC_01760]WTE58467.1 chloride channel protein [Streptomyces sp. NBC_01617]WTI92249.1 chloride channel protein [Streptomyces sp. NBC_00724]